MLKLSTMVQGNEKIKVMLASRPKMLSEVIRDMVERQPDMEVVGEVIDPIELFFTAKVTKIDIVIVTPLNSEKESSICHHLLAECPHLKIVTLPVKGENAFLYESSTSRKCIEDPSVQTILSAIRGAMRSISD